MHQLCLPLSLLEGLVTLGENLHQVGEVCLQTVANYDQRSLSRGGPTKFS